MSKLRHDPALAQAQTTDDLDVPVEGDLEPYVVFTQFVTNGPFVYAGWLDAADDKMALTFACEHYGQDQECVAIWTIPRRYIAGLRMNREAAAEPVAAARMYQVFTQKKAGDQHVSADTVEATCAAEAAETARRTLPDGGELHSIWAAPRDEIVATDPDDLIWRYTDQSYRLARGYSKDVREKWQRIREEQALHEYEKEDLEESF